MDERGEYGSSNGAAEPSALHAVSAPARVRAIDRPWFILTLLFGVAAVFGLPFLWISRAFSAPVKFLLTIAVLLYTALLLWLFWLVVLWCWGRIEPTLHAW
jgi:hypothetical protein